MRKFLVTMLCGGALALVAAGCGKGSASSRPLRVSFFAEIDILTIQKAHLKIFEKETGIKVEAVYIPYANYNEKLLTQISAKQEPDLIWTEVSQFVNFQSAGAFLPLNERVKAEAFDLGQYYPELVQRFTVGGQLYALPQDTAPIACLYYNKAMFKKAGLPFPKKDWTWAQFLKASQKLVQRDGEGKVSCYAFMDNYGPDWAGIIYSNGGRLVDNVQKPSRCLVDSPEAVEAIQFLADLMLKYKVSPPMSAKSGVMASGQDEFMLGRVAMVRSGLWITPALRKSSIEWDMAPFPSGPKAKGGKGGWGTGGSGYAISKNSQRPDDAWRLAKFLASKESQKAYVKTGYVQPAIKSLAESREFLEDAPPANKTFLLEAVKRSVYSPMHPKWSEAQLSIIENVLSEVWLGSLSAKDAMSKAAKDVNKLLFGK